MTPEAQRQHDEVHGFLKAASAAVEKVYAENYGILGGVGMTFAVSIARTWHLSRQSYGGANAYQFGSPSHADAAKRDFTAKLSRVLGRRKTRT